MNRKLVLPVALMVVFALSRIPGMLPPSFSAVYALMFCAGVYFAGRLVYVPLYAWGVPVVRTIVWGVAMLGIAMVLVGLI